MKGCEVSTLSLLQEGAQNLVGPGPAVPGQKNTAGKGSLLGLFCKAKGSGGTWPLLAAHSGGVC